MSDGAFPTLLPGATIGIFGGGQLGRLTAMAARSMGYRILVLDPDPEDLTWVATDLLALACGEQDPDPERIAEQFSDAIPPGEESWIFGLMAESSHAEVARLLTILARYHPDRQIAKDARRAARMAGKNRTVTRAGRAPARATAR